MNKYRFDLHHDFRTILFVASIKCSSQLSMAALLTCHFFSFPFTSTTCFMQLFASLCESQLVVTMVRRQKPCQIMQNKNLKIKQGASRLNHPDNDDLLSIMYMYMQSDQLQRS